MADEALICILLVDSEIINLQNVGHFLEQNGYQVDTAADSSKAISLLAQESYDLVITDLKIGEVGGVEVLKSVKEMYPQIEVIIFTGCATINSAVEAMSQGTFYYMAKPIKLKELHELVAQATEKTLLRRGISRLK